MLQHQSLAGQLRKSTLNQHVKALSRLLADGEVDQGLPYPYSINLLPCPRQTNCFSTLIAQDFLERMYRFPKVVLNTTGRFFRQNLHKPSKRCLLNFWHTETLRVLAKFSQLVRVSSRGNGIKNLLVIRHWYLQTGCVGPPYPNFSAIHILISDCRVTPSRPASLSRSRTIQAGKSRVARHPNLANMSVSATICHMEGRRCQTFI